MEFIEVSADVFPRILRSKLKIRKWDKFVALATNDEILFKKLYDPALEFEKLSAKCAERMEKSEIKESDVEDIIHEFRGVKSKK